PSNMKTTESESIPNEPAKVFAKDCGFLHCKVRSSQVVSSSGSVPRSIVCPLVGRKRRSYGKQRRSLPKLDGRSRGKLVKVCEYDFEAALNAQERIDSGSRSSHSDSTH